MAEGRPSSQKEVQVLSPATTPGTTPPPSPTGPLGAVKVGDVVTRGLTVPVCAAEFKLSDVAHLLLSTDQSAAAVVDGEGSAVGLLTETDIIRAYFQGAPWDCRVGEWLRGRGAFSEGRAASDGLAGITVLPDQPLQEAVLRLVPPAPWGIHLLVQGMGGRYYGVLGPLSVARAAAARGVASLLGPSAAQATVAEVMQSRDVVPVCSPGCNMQQVLQALLASREHAVLVADLRGVHGLVTARDVLWAFNQQIPRSAMAWQRFANHPGCHKLKRRVISSAAPLQIAAEAMSAGCGLQHLVVLEPGGMEVVGLLSPLELMRCASNSRPALKKPERAESSGTGAVQKQPVRVADIVAQRETATCSATCLLHDACSILLASGRTAAVVLDPAGTVLGVLTENDVLQALVEGVPEDLTVGLWLRGGEARLPGFLVSALTVRPESLLVEAAARMAVQTEGDYACHHLLVCDSQGQGLPVPVPGTVPGSARLLSALDIARGMIDAAERDVEVSREAAAAAGLSVAQAMKPRATVPTCLLSDTLADAFDVLCKSHHNCILVVPSSCEVGEVPASDPMEVEGAELAQEVKQQPGGTVIGGSLLGGVATSADALRAFSARLPCASVNLAYWLRRFGGPGPEPRLISSDASLASAAATMSEAGVHHLLVEEPARSKVVGVISALDIVCAIGSLYLTPPCLSTKCHWNISAEAASATDFGI